MKQLLRVAIRRALFISVWIKTGRRNRRAAGWPRSGGLRNQEFRSTSGAYPDVASSRLSESRSTSPNREGRRTSLAQPPKKRPRNRASVLQENQWAIGGQSLSAAFRSTGAISGQQHTRPRRGSRGWHSCKSCGDGRDRKSVIRVSENGERLAGAGRPFIRVRTVREFPLRI